MAATDLAGNVGGDGFGFDLGLFKHQRFNALAGVGDKDKIGDDKHRSDSGTCHYNELCGE